MPPGRVSVNPSRSRRVTGRTRSVGTASAEGYRGRGAPRRERHRRAVTMTRRTRIGLVVLFALATPAAADDPGGPDDEALLQKHLGGADAGRLLSYLRRQSPTDDERRRLAGLVRQLGDANFRKRDEAARELTAAGWAVLPLLREAVRDADREVAGRARRIAAEIESGSGLGLPAAVARRLARLRPAGAVAALVAYRPHVEDGYLADLLAAALSELAREPAERAALERAAADADP